MPSKRTWWWQTQVGVVCGRLYRPQTMTQCCSPIEQRPQLLWLNARWLCFLWTINAQIEHFETPKELRDLPDSRKISTVKKMIASIPLICCNTSSIRPMINGIIRGRVKITSRNFGATVPLLAGLFSNDAAIALSSSDSNSIAVACSFNHLTDCSASWNRFLLRNQTGDSGMANIAMPRKTDMAQQYQASMFHLAMLPMMYALKMPTDIIIDGNDPKMPRIAGSQLSPIWWKYRKSLLFISLEKSSDFCYINLCRW